MPSKATDLITFQDVRAAAVGAVDSITDIEFEVTAMIAEVTSRINSYVGYHVIAHQVTEGFAACEWRPVDWDDSGDVYVWATDQPIIEVETSDVSVGYDKRRLTRNAPQAGTVTYWAGYARPDQDASDFSGLDTDPSDVPPDIRSVATRLVLYRLMQQRGDLGQRTVTSIGGSQATIEVTDRQFEQRELRRLRRTYKRHM